MTTKRKLRIGDWVVVRSKEEIFRTLDAKGRLDGMPFMPEMLAFCGQKFQIYKIAHKTCDYSVYPYRVRRLARTVHLKTRCDGQAHGGCQAGCLLYWKEDWLKSVGESPVETASQRTAARRAKNDNSHPEAGCSESDVWEHVKVPHAASESPAYLCQMTQVPLATTPLPWWDIRQYADDYLSGNVTLRRLLTTLIYWAYYSLSQAGIGVGRPMRWLYDKMSPLWGGPLFPRKLGVIPDGQPTPLVKLNLRPGEMVRVKTYEEILKTVDVSNRNRGMYWDAELVPYCGGTYKVLGSVSRLIGERTGKMQEMKNPCIILDSVVCQARYSSCRLFCPKSIYPYWRESWLERVEPAKTTPQTTDNAPHSFQAGDSQRA
jgi:hypothetical protein